MAPTRAPTSKPTANPSFYPTEIPTANPVGIPTEIPTVNPSEMPTVSPTATPTKQYVATFGAGSNGVTGTVTVNDGQVIVDLDLSSEPALPTDFATCTTGGLSYHIHEKWTHGDNNDRLIADCGAAFTGGHWDPLNACGPASGSDWCDAACIDTANYSPNFSDDPWSAEVGDWSAKYGKLTLDGSNMISRTESSFYEAMSREMQAKSVVFHCADGSRAFCAPFVESSEEVTATSIPQEGTTEVTADFGSVGSITMYPSGAVTIDLDMTGVSTSCAGALGYGLFEKGTQDLDGYTLSCYDEVGYPYDPTNSCFASRNDGLCTDGELCNGFSNSMTYSYDCDFSSNNRYSCAPGDLSGKFGLITNPTNTTWFVPYSGDESLIPMTEDMTGLVMAIYCAADATPVMCAPITVTATGMPTTNPSAMPTEGTATTATPTATPTAAVHTGKQYVATFGAGSNGVTGTVTVNDGQVIVDLDLSDEPALPDGFATCTAGGLKGHIHNSWTHGDTDDRLGGTDCGAAYTGGHYDPWNACGPASGSSYCDKSDDLSGELTASCVPASDYSPNFAAEPFSAEVGDWSGKYGVLELDADNEIKYDFSSYYEVKSAEMAGLSVVFHCNGGSRAFCAPFVASSADVSAQELVQDTEGNAVVANFQAALTTESQVTLYPNGDVIGTLDVMELYSNMAEVSDACDELAYGIFEAGTTTLTESSIDCANAVGAAYDPTDSCVDFSESDHCTNGVLCNGNNDSAYEYNCDFAADRYSCAPGDLSGKFGLITDPLSPFSLMYEDDDLLLPITDDVIGKVIAIYCPYAASSSPVYLACAPIEQVVSDPDGDSSDETDWFSGVEGLSFVMAIVVSLIAILH